MRRAIITLSIMLPATAGAASLHPLVGAPGGDLSAAGADTRVAEWAEQMLNQDLAPPKAARHSQRSEPVPETPTRPEPVPATAAAVLESAQSAVPAVALNAASESPAAANEPALAARPASSVAANAPDAGAAQTDAVTALNGITVMGRRDALQASDQRLQKTIDALPQLGDGGRIIDETPKAVILGTTLVLSAARQLLFKQPRVRGEASDEALFNAQSGVCTADAPFRCLTSDKQP